MTLSDPHSPTPRVVVLASNGIRPDWCPGTAVEPRVAVIDPTRNDRDLAVGLGAATAVFIDGGNEAPLSLARRVHRLAPGVQLAIVAPEDDHGRLRRSTLFTPGIGEIWISAPEEVTPALLESATSIGLTRRSHRARTSWMSRQVTGIVGLGAVKGGRPFLADRYLATLLRLLPDPVIALDDAGAVVFTNPPAASLLHVERNESVSREELAARLRPVDGSSWDGFLEEGRKGVVREVLEFGSTDARRIFQAVAGPVDGERPMLAILLHDITEQIEAEEELRSLMKHRTRFYASMSHELRTPINAILGYTELLRHGVYGPLAKLHDEPLERITRAGAHLLDLVNDVLDLSKLEAGKIQVSPALADLRELERNLEATIRPLADENGVDLSFSLGESCSEPFLTDPRHLQQIVMNLLSNAIRYGAGAPVEVRCSIEGDRLVVEVEDQGPGIPGDKLEEIFDDFVQLEGEEKGGTGLGLAISRGLTRSLGGELSVESVEGKGSVFRVEVPRLEGEPDEVR